MGVSRQHPVPVAKAQQMSGDIQRVLPTQSEQPPPALCGYALHKQCVLPANVLSGIATSPKYLVASSQKSHPRHHRKVLQIPTDRGVYRL
jgi:hypothetical protein